MSKSQKRKSTNAKRHKRKTESKGDMLSRVSYQPMPVLVTARKHQGRASVTVLERNGSVSIDGSALTFPDFNSAEMVLAISGQ